MKLWLLILAAAALAQIVIPSSHSARNRILLDRLEQQHITQTTTTTTDEVEHVVTVRNASGEVYLCTTTHRTLEPPSSTEGEEEKELEQPPVKFSQAALDARLPLLHGACVTYNAGWWTTKWCHQSETRQVHLENNKEVTSYSLGKPVPGGVQVKFENQIPLFLLETFDGGQVCDETGLGRRIEVRLYCCEASEPSSTYPEFFSMQETTTCSYTMMLCWQPLCGAGLSPLSSSNKDSWAALRPMTGLCYQHVDDHNWVHEVCFERSARVFRQSKDANTGRMLQLDSKHMGSFADHSLANNEVVQTYSNGDWCGSEEGKLRYSSRVRLSCFLTKGTSPEIVSFQVTSKCETEVLLHAPGLCNSRSTTTTTATSHRKHPPHSTSNNALSAVSCSKLPQQSPEL
ncbi:hypothetical protein BASA81_010253 [Batrachochytrium salamandrivorans]|nr:hypothetical protein BASA81_010253 [Batrachochytrium salamandrivorans]